MIKIIKLITYVVIIKKPGLEIDLQSRFELPSALLPEDYAEVPLSEQKVPN